MTGEQFERLLDLHRAAMVAQESAIGDGRLWPAAHAADSAFTGELQSMVTSSEAVHARGAGRAHSESVGSSADLAAGRGFGAALFEGDAQTSGQEDSDDAVLRRHGEPGFLPALQRLLDAERDCRDVLVITNPKLISAVVQILRHDASPSVGAPCGAGCGSSNPTDGEPLPAGGAPTPSVGSTPNTPRPAAPGLTQEQADKLLELAATPIEILESETRYGHRSSFVPDEIWGKIAQAMALLDAALQSMVTP